MNLFVRSLLIALTTFGMTGPIYAQALHLEDLAVGTPFRVRDMTFPSPMILGFMPSSGASLGKGVQAFEVNFSRVNNWQVSAAGEQYLAATRPDGVRRRLDEQDVTAFLNLGRGNAVYVDGEFDLMTVTYHRGLTDRLDLGVSLHYLGYDGGSWDSTIESFHDSAGFSQQGREFVERHRFQVVLGPGDDGTGVFYFSEPTSRGLGDPSISLRYALPGSPGGWLFNVEGAIKLPIGDDEEFLSSGSVDVGARITMDKQWNRNAFIADFYLIFPGDFEAGSELNRVEGTPQKFSPPSVLPGLNLSYLYRFGRWPKTMFFLQGVAAENIFSDFGSSELSELELLLTLGFKWTTGVGEFGVGLTENLANFDNTPDIGMHLSWARRF